VKHVLFVLAALVTAASCGKPQSGFAACDHMMNNRRDYGTVVHLYGDSISRGRAVGQFEDGETPLNPGHPLYRFRSIASMANWALEHNGRAERFVYCGNIEPDVIRALIRSRVIRAGDTIILEDAGDYTAGPRAYYAFWRRVREAASAEGVKVVMMTMFDYCRGGNMACDPAMQYDTPIGAQGTLNDATRRAAGLTANPVAPNGHAFDGALHLIDMNWVMDAWRASALSIDGVDVMLPDGVHPNVWGQMKMTQHYLAAAGLSQYVVDVDPMQDLAEEHHRLLAYGSTTFTGERARTYVAAMLAAPPPGSADERAMR
jgi:hypothetical protein